MTAHLAAALPLPHGLQTAVPVQQLEHGHHLDREGDQLVTAVNNISRSVDSSSTAPNLGCVRISLDFDLHCNLT